MVNKVMLVGRLGRDAEFKIIASGAAVAKFSLAMSEKWKDKNGETQERTEWANCVLWGKAAEALSKYLTKGTQAYVEGSLQTRSYDKDGSTRYVTEVKVDQVRLLGGSRSESSNSTGEVKQSIIADPQRSNEVLKAVPEETFFSNEDVPF